MTGCGRPRSLPASKPALGKSHGTRPQADSSRQLTLSTLLKIFAGLDRKLFYDHEELLHDRLQVGFNEDREKEMELPENDPVVFAEIANWVYRRSVKCGKPNDRIIESGIISHIIPLCGTYVLNVVFLGSEHVVSGILSWSQLYESCRLSPTGSYSM